MKTYSEKLKDPRWQRKRLEVMERDGFACRQCGDADSTLHVHHWKYAREPWEANLEDLETFCEDCHAGIEFAFSDFKKKMRNLEFRRTMDLMGEFFQECRKRGTTYKRMTFFDNEGFSDIFLLASECGDPEERDENLIVSFESMISEFRKEQEGE